MTSQRHDQVLDAFDNTADDDVAIDVFRDLSNIHAGFLETHRALGRIIVLIVDRRAFLFMFLHKTGKDAMLLNDLLLVTFKLAFSNVIDDEEVLRVALVEVHVVNLLIVWGPVIDHVPVVVLLA